ncbi:twin-arginine translocase TatA/TatE family subunit [Nitrospira sp. M1]
MIGSFGWMELLLILIIVLIVFGAGKIPQLGEGLGKAIKGFKKSVHEADALDVTPNPDQPNMAQEAPPQPEQVASQQTAQTVVQPPSQPEAVQPPQPEQARQG